MRPATRFVYPNSIGVTGEVYKTKNIVWTNEIKSLKKYVENIDNLSKTEDVKSILVAPIFGHPIDDKSN